MKKVYSKFLITILVLVVTSVFIFGQKNVVFIGRGAEGSLETYMSDKDLVDSLTAWGFVVTYVSNDTYKAVDGSVVYAGMDAIFMNETVDSKAMIPFGPDRDNYPLPCVSLEPWVVHQDRWGWVGDISTDLLQVDEGTATADHAVMVILDNEHYITQPFGLNDEVIWSTAVDADLADTRPSVFKEVNVPYSGKLATVKANINDADFYNLVTVDASAGIPNKVVMWGINANGLNGIGDQDKHYGTNEFFTLVRRACEWAYDEMPGVSEIENHAMDSYQLIAFPNPASEQATIRFNVSEPASAKVTFYDVTGQQADVLLNENVQTGNNFIFMDVTSYAKGVYFVKLQFGERTEFTKLVIK